ncbi:MAG: HAD hydrolase family protein, partial [Clostridia bacterium]|nr:HAD hydrolase family protein [Clostridia bacterium]
MGKFDGILLCTDLDGTLLTSESIVSEENIRAINYFKEQGGKFTFVTGRVPKGAGLMRKWVEPNAPIVVFNGAGVYDFEKEELLWGTYLGEDSKKVVEYVEARTPDFGLVVCTDEKVYFPVM